MNKKIFTKCDKCGKSLKIVSLKSHVKMVHEAQRIHECEVCKMKFKQEKVLENHMTALHSDVKTVTCDKCNSEFPNKVILRRHMKNEHFVKVEKKTVLKKCDLCGKMLKETSLPTHIKDVHENASMVKCGHCNMSFVSKYSLKNHLFSIHVGTKHKCNQCDKSFNAIGNLKRHEKYVHELKGQKECKCDLCGKNFKSQDSLKVHKDAVHLKNKAMKCEKCNKIFTTKSNLEFHNQSVHEKVESKCNLCGKMFLHLNQHMKNSHENKKNLYECNQCIKAFDRKSTLDNHVRMVHKKEKLYKCNFCGKDWFNTVKLKRHIDSVHNHKKDYFCKLCNKFLSQNHKSHQEMHAKRELNM